MTAQLETAVAEHEAARAELGDVLQAWQRDREELAEQIRWALCEGSECIAAAVLWRPALGWQDHTRASLLNVPYLHPSHRALHYNLALKTLVIDAFIPQEEVSKVGWSGRNSSCCGSG